MASRAVCRGHVGRPFLPRDVDVAGCLKSDWRISRWTFHHHPVTHFLVTQTMFFTDSGHTGKARVANSAHLSLYYSTKVRRPNIFRILTDPASVPDYIRINTRNFNSAADTPGYDSDLNKTVIGSRNGTDQRGTTVTLKYINFESD